MDWLPPPISWIPYYFGAKKEPEKPKQTHEVRSVAELDDALDASLEYVVVVLFYGEWTEYLPKLESIVQLISPVKCYSVNAYSLKSIADDCGVRVLPTAMIFRGSAMQAKLEGNKIDTLDAVVGRLADGWGARRFVEGRNLDNGRITY